MYRRTYLNIPISLCIFALKNGLIGQLSLYCYLKSQSDGTIINPASFRLAYCKAVGCSEPTFYSRLRWLRKNKWIYKTAADTITVLSFEKLMQYKSIETTTNRGTLLEFDYFKSFSKFIYASVVTYFARKKLWLDTRSSAVKRGAYRGAGAPTLSIPYQYLASCLNCKKVNAQFFIRASGHYLKTKCGYLKLCADISQLSYIRKYSEYGSNRIVVRKGEIYVQLTNIMFSSIVIKKRKFKAIS